jgi:excisionase family DNA binding protein
MNHLSPLQALRLRRQQNGAPAGSPLEPMLSLAELAELLNCSRRLIDRMRSAGKMPQPDILLGRRPRWQASTIRAWIEQGGKSQA